MSGFGFGFGFSPLGALLNQTPQHYYVNEIARTALRDTSFVGTVRHYPGTYATITAAIAAAADGDIIQLSADVDTTAEPGGYLMIDCPTKALHFIGNIADRTEIKWGRSGDGFSSRNYRAKELKFTSISFATTGSSPPFYVDADQANRIMCFKDCNLSVTGNGTSSAFIMGTNAAWGTSTALFQFDNCTLTKTQAGLRPFAFNNQGINTLLMLNNCTLNGATMAAMDIIDGNEMTVCIYDSTINQSADITALKFGTDTTVPTKTIGMIDIRNTTITYSTGKGQHAILLGRSCKKHYVVNNRISMDAVSNTLNIGIANKSTPTTVADGIIAGNIVTAPRPMVIKGGKFIKAKYNTLVSNVATYASLVIDNANEGDGVLPVTDCDIQYNNVFGKGAAIAFGIGTDPLSSDSAQSCVFDYNNYFSDNGDWAYDGVIHQLATKISISDTATTHDDK